MSRLSKVKGLAPRPEAAKPGERRLMANPRYATRRFRWGFAAMLAALATLGRAHHQVLKVARTLADLAHMRDIRPEHVGEALRYRGIQRSAE